MEQKFFRVNENLIVRLNRIIEIRLNQNGAQGWIRFDTGEGKINSYKISPGQYVELCEILFDKKKSKIEEEII